MSTTVKLVENAAGRRVREGLDDHLGLTGHARRGEADLVGAVVVDRRAANHGDAIAGWLHDCGAGDGEANDELVGLRQLDDGAAVRVGDRWLVFTTDALISSVIERKVRANTDIRIGSTLIAA